ncbi:MAG TPA: anti-sigma factor antagonist [Candidatus Omnitrophica bacterium]|nr:MAG: anti-sigma factor antagonist [Candidatus Omnitrophota bacterium]RKY34644.1 MAG: anti-sigma factor antagonist [Candidatus Omnitrophota bacterium]RKY43526.1 MAG: anti-sigma factor antagonist [Candidatus Omnitrophota bacterium]HEC69835.1 anti-sigma factor antagonist [Candidatus Omnitrophota bacterium]
MKIREEKQGEVLIYALEGEVNINTSPELRKAFDKIIREGQKKVIVDFSEISYIDSSGLATLIEMYQRLKKNGGRLRLCAMGEKVRSVFEITKLVKLFEIFPNLTEALEGF